MPPPIYTARLQTYARIRRASSGVHVIAEITAQVGTRIYRRGAARRGASVASSPTSPAPRPHTGGGVRERGARALTFIARAIKRLRLHRVTCHM